MLGFLNNSSKKDKIIVVFDIGSGSVGGAIVKIPAQATNPLGSSDRDKYLPSIIKSARVDIKLCKNVEIDKLLEEMLKSLKVVADNIHGSKADNPSQIFCVLSSPWYISENRLVKTEHDKPFIFTQRLADDLLSEEISSFTTLYQHTYGSTDSIPEIIENHITTVSANGYPCALPIGVSTNSIEMNMIISVVPKLFLDKIRKVISNTWSHKSVYFSSFALSSYMAVKDLYINSDSYILLDISGEITDVSIISKGVFKTSLSFPFGKNKLFNHITNALKIELRDVKELFNLYMKNTLLEKDKEKVIQAFNAAEKSWSTSFKECVGSLRYTFILPETVFLTADEDIKLWFKDVISREEYLQSMVAGNKWKVITLDGPEFLNMCSIEDGPCDPFLMIESIAIMRKLQKQK